MKLSEMETESKGLTDRLKADILEREEQIDVMQKQIEKSEDDIRSLEKRISELQSALEEKDQLVVELRTRETLYETHKAEVSSTNSSMKFVQIWPSLMVHNFFGHILDYEITS